MVISRQKYLSLKLRRKLGEGGWRMDGIRQSDDDKTRLGSISTCKGPQLNWHLNIIELWYS